MFHTKLIYLLEHGTIEQKITVLATVPVWLANSNEHKLSPTVRFCKEYSEEHKN